jgi:suppressor of ftsI
MYRFVSTQYKSRGNVGTNSFVQVAFDPPVNATIIAVDGMATDRGLSLPAGGWLLPPGSRVEMIVEGPAEGTYKIVSKEIPYARSPEGGTVLATLKAEAPRSLKAGVASRKAQAQAPRARSAYYPRNEEFQAPPVVDGCDLHSKPPDTPKTKGCTFVFSDKDGDYMINDKVYKEGITDVTCKIRKDKVYDWTLCNDTDEHHAFHIHQIHFEVVDVDGHPIDAPVRDVVDLPQRPDDDHVSQVRIKMSFQHDYLAGKFVFHCHMLEHEDKGMMMNIDLVP